MRKECFRLLLPLALASLTLSSLAQSPRPQATLTVAPQYQMTVRTQKTIAPVQKAMYGVFFEDINFGADGGLYAELVKNRSFEFNNALVGWLPFGDVSVRSDNPCFDRNPHYVRINYVKQLTRSGLQNEGFRGIGLKQGEAYNFRMFARTAAQGNQRILVELVNSANDIVGSANITVAGSEWKEVTASLTARTTDAHCVLRVTLTAPGQVDLDHISLFPAKTFNNRSNGLRADMAQALADLNPGVFRFPGGCIVEGNNLATRYQWKNSIGPVENRPINENRWFYTFKYKLTPDYYQSYGLGFYEYFLLCEDLGAEPLPVLHVGLSCQYENKDPNENVPLDQLDPYIQDVIDLIEFANGPVTSVWGSKRAEMGHPEPFNLKMVAIGNEQWGELYTDRLALFVAKVRKAYPKILIVGGSGPSSDGKDFDFLWPKMKELKVDLVDEHYYKNPEWFFSNARRYDSYDRKGPKVFAGEYASHHASRANNFEAALSEAAFMTGLERNADVVHLATYAPLFAHKDAWQWRPDLIWVDNLQVVKSINYYVQQLYMHNKGSHVLSLTMNNEPVAGQDRLYASSVLESATNEVIVKLVNASEQVKSVQLNFDGLDKAQKSGTMTTLSASSMTAENTFEAPYFVVPQTTGFTFEGGSYVLQARPNTFYVLRFTRK